jgi:hypothetical protein
MEMGRARFPTATEGKVMLNRKDYQWIPPAFVAIGAFISLLILHRELSTSHPLNLIFILSFSTASAIYVLTQRIGKLEATLQAIRSAKEGDTPIR